MIKLKCTFLSRSRGGSLKRSPDVTTLKQKTIRKDSKDDCYIYVRKADVSNIPGKRN